ncbi:MAG: acyl-CoA thioesterase [Candidatus Omnitrophica bacterium]|nr:acyl-CoA thioesterase [Candidatus Omnitrophota bacterium]
MASLLSKIRNAGLDLENRVFVYDRRVYLTDTNLEGNVYFSRYFDWQGVAREEYFRVAVPDHMQILQSGYKLITVNAWMSYKREATLFDEIRIAIKTKNFTHTSFDMLFAFMNKKANDIIAFGGQKLAFAQNGKLVSIPPTIRAGAEMCLDDAAAGDRDMPDELTKGKLRVAVGGQ